MSPSLVARPAFLAADASPRLRRIVFASSKLPFASVSADLHSIIPAPVWSRSFFTMPAVIAIVVLVISFVGRAFRERKKSIGLHAQREREASAERVSVKRWRARSPADGAAAGPRAEDRFPTQRLRQPRRAPLRRRSTASG